MKKKKQETNLFKKEEETNQYLQREIRIVHFRKEERNEEGYSFVGEERYAISVSLRVYCDGYAVRFVSKLAV